MVCLFVFFCHAPSPARCSFKGVYFEQVLYQCSWVDFDAVSRFFSEGTALSGALHSSHFLLLGGATIFAKLWSKLQKRPKSAEKFARTTSYR